MHDELKLKLEKTLTEYSVFFSPDQRLVICKILSKMFHVKHHKPAAM